MKQEGPRIHGAKEPNHFHGAQRGWGGSRLLTRCSMDRTVFPRLHTGLFPPSCVSTARRSLPSHRRPVLLWYSVFSSNCFLVSLAMTGVRPGNFSQYDSQQEWNFSVALMCSGWRRMEVVMPRTVQVATGSYATRKGQMQL